MNKPTVSIIVPVYNAEKYLSQNLQSLLEQTLQELELIAVDDNSTDGSVAILEEFARKDDRVIVVQHQQNQGAGAARNTGLNRARGTYLLFADADDFYDPDTLAECVAKFENDNSDIVIFRAKSYNDKTHETILLQSSLRLDFCPDHTPFVPIEMQKYLFNAFMALPGNKMFRCSFIKESGLYFPITKRINDMPFVLTALATAHNITLLDRSFFYYRVKTGNSLTDTRDSSPLAFWAAWLDTKQKLESYGVYEEFEQSFLNYLLRAFENHLNLLKTTEAYRDVLFLAKYKFESEFAFLSHPITFYYDLHNLATYLQIYNSVQIHSRHEIVPKVTIVIPTDNDRNLIRESVESVLEQTIPEVEVLCVDAGSDDGTWEVLQEYTKVDDRVRILRPQTKVTAFSLVLQQASGKYVLLLRPGDYLLPNACAVFYRLAEEHQTDILKSNYKVFNGRKNQYQFIKHKCLQHAEDYNKVIDPEDWNKQSLQDKLPEMGFFRLEFLRDNCTENMGRLFTASYGAGRSIPGWDVAKRVYFTDKYTYCLSRNNPHWVSEGNDWSRPPDYKRELDRTRKELKQIKNSKSYKLVYGLASFLHNLRKIFCI